MAQLRVVRVPILRLGIAYLRWGPVCVRKGTTWDEDIWRAVTHALVREYVERRGLVLRILPFAFHQDPAARTIAAAWAEAGLIADRRVDPYLTFRLDLHPPLDELRRRLAHKWRNQLNAAERNELDVSAGTDASHFREFTALYTAMMTRKQFATTVNIAPFERIQERLPSSQKMQILICRKNGRPMSGLVASTIGGTGIYLLGATGDEGLKVKGSYVLQWQMLCRLKQLGCAWYDLGGINARTNPGVYHFKQGMGGDEAEHLGRFEVTKSGLSRVAVSLAERLQSKMARVPRPLRNAPPVERPASSN